MNSSSLVPVNNDVHGAYRLVRQRPRTYVRLPDVLRVDGEGAYSLIQLANGERIRVSVSIQVMARRMPELVRCRRGLLINLAYVRAVPRHRNVMVLLWGEILPVARRRKSEVRQRFIAYKAHETQRPTPS